MNGYVVHFLVSVLVVIATVTLAYSRILQPEDVRTLLMACFAYNAGRLTPLNGNGKAISNS